MWAKPWNVKEGFLIGGGLLFTGVLLQVAMGLGAGARTCGVSYGNPTPEALVAAGANHVIDDLSQLPALVCVVN